MLQPKQHPFHSQNFPVVPALAASRARQHEMMQPYPQVPEQKPDRHVQEPHVELFRGRPDPALVHLPIAGLDPEPLPVRLLHPIHAPRRYAPVGIYPRVGLLLAMPVLPPRPFYADRHGRFVPLAVLERVLEPAALLHQLENVRSAGSQRMIGLAAMADRRHQERPPRPLQVTDDLHAVETTVQEQQPRLEPCLAHQRQQLSEHLLE